MKLLKRGLSRIAAGENPSAIILENFQLVHLIRAFPSACAIFDYIDDAFGFADYPRHVHVAWQEALEAAHAVVATSPALSARIRTAGERTVRLIPNGVEYAKFKGAWNSPRPVDLPPPGKPIAGYVGSVYPWIDFALLEKAAISLHEVQFVIIGQEHPEVRKDLERLRILPNVSILGVRPYASIPAYLAHFHAGMIPFRSTRLTAAVNPVKLYEYSAAGVPTVATDFSPDTGTCAPFVFIAKTGEEFVRLLREAIRRRDDRNFVATLHEFARSNDWDSRAEEFLTIVQHSH
jgi:glycosyltransferase involved in cell wall biosynthesis